MNLAYVLIPLLPLLGYLVSGILAPRFFPHKSHLVAVPAVFISFFLSVLAFVNVQGGQTFDQNLYSWVAVGNLHIEIGLKIDQLTVMMLLLVTGVSSLVHLYTVGYMHGDRGYDRFFAHISLFTFSMITLVMANNFLLLFFGWEAVGLCSYLLIAHWYERKTAQDAALKAFIQNRVGDFGFLLGIFLVFAIFGAIDYKTVFENAALHAHESINILGWQVNVITAIDLLLFMGAMGKSAQIFLHPWLIDAMEGPTPISALIHAATMVTAGIFMVAQLNPLFNLSPTAMAVVAVVGAVSAIIAATMGLVATDIKRIIAFSTMSQLGYMFLACGVGAYSVGIFHLLAHGAFKALLFLGAGSVIHGLSGQQDIRKMGALRKYFPVTFPTMLIAALALAGIPIFAGFFSKDAILWQAFMAGGFNQFLWGLGLITVLLTAFYSFRLIFVVFFGESRVDHEVAHHIHESPWVMTVPLVLLAIPATFIGFANQWSYEFLGEVLGPTKEFHGAVNLEHIMAGVSVGVALIGIALAWYFYVKNTGLPKMLASANPLIYDILLKKYYFDEFYELIFVKPTRVLSSFLWKKTDEKVIDGAVNNVGIQVDKTSRVLSFFQSGYLHHYGLLMALGILLIITFYLIFGRSV